MPWRSARRPTIWKSYSSLWLVELTVSMEMFTTPAKDMLARWVTAATIGSLPLRLSGSNHDFLTGMFWSDKVWPCISVCELLRKSERNNLQLFVGWVVLHSTNYYVHSLVPLTFFVFQMNLFSSSIVSWLQSISLLDGLFLSLKFLIQGFSERQCSERMGNSQPKLFKQWAVHVELLRSM